MPECLFSATPSTRYAYYLAQIMPKFTENFSMTFAKNRTYGVPEFAGTEVNRHSGKLKGLSGYLQNHYPRVMKSKFQTTHLLSTINKTDLLLMKLMVEVSTSSMSLSWQPTIYFYDKIHHYQGTLWPFSYMMLTVPN